MFPLWRIDISGIDPIFTCLNKCMIKLLKKLGNFAQKLSLWNLPHVVTYSNQMYSVMSLKDASAHPYQVQTHWWSYQNAIFNKEFAWTRLMRITATVQSSLHVILRWLFERLQERKEFLDVRNMAGMILETFTSVAKWGRKLLGPFLWMHSRASTADYALKSS